MHPYERIAIWTILVILIFTVFFRGTSEFTPSQFNLMSMKEFEGVPYELKQIYATAMTPVTQAAAGKVREYWNTLGAADKQALKTEVMNASARATTNINSADPKNYMQQMMKKPPVMPPPMPMTPPGVIPPVMAVPMGYPVQKY